MFVEQHPISSSIYVELCHSWKTLNSAKTTVKCTQIIVKLASGGIHTTCLKVHQTHWEFFKSIIYGEKHSKIAK